MRLETALEEFENISVHGASREEVVRRLLMKTELDQLDVIKYEVVEHHGRFVATGFGIRFGGENDRMH